MGPPSTASPLSPHSYTYGKPVQGKVQAGFCLSQRFWHDRRRKTCIQVIGQVSWAGWDWGCHWDGSLLGMLLMALIFPPDGEEWLLFHRGFVGFLQHHHLEAEEGT